MSSHTPFKQSIDRPKERGNEYVTSGHCAGRISGMEVLVDKMECSEVS